MKITITSYMTAVDELDPLKGNHKRWSVIVERDNGGENYGNLSEREVIKRISELLNLR